MKLIRKVDFEGGMTLPKTNESVVALISGKVTLRSGKVRSFLVELTAGKSNGRWGCCSNAYLKVAPEELEVDSDWIGDVEHHINVLAARSYLDWLTDEEGSLDGLMQTVDYETMREYV